MDRRRELRNMKRNLQEELTELPPSVGHKYLLMVVWFLLTNRKATVTGVVKMPLGNIVFME